MNSNNVIGKDAAKTSTVPVRPEKVAFVDIQQNGKLLTDDEIERAKKVFEKLGPANNGELQIIGLQIRDYQQSQLITILKTPDQQYYAVYDKNPLGKGMYGEVYCAQNLETAEWMAVKKQVRNAEISTAETLNAAQGTPIDIKQRLADSMSEIEKKLDIESNAAKALGLSVADATIVTSNESKDKYQYEHFMLMGLLSGKSLEGITADPNLKLSFESQLIIAEKSLDQFVALHSNGYIHGDISKNNVLINPANMDDIKVGLVDLGEARKVQKYADTASEVRQIAINLFEDLFKDKFSRDRDKFQARDNINLSKAEIKLLNLLNEMIHTDQKQRPGVETLLTQIKEIKNAVLNEKVISKDDKKATSNPAPNKPRTATSDEAKKYIAEQLKKTILDRRKATSVESKQYIVDRLNEMAGKRRTATSDVAKEYIARKLQKIADSGTESSNQSRSKIISNPTIKQTDAAKMKAEAAYNLIKTKLAERKEQNQKNKNEDTEPEKNVNSRFKPT